MERERHEPTFNRDQQLKEIEFQRRYGPKPSSNGLIWKVALGVFLGFTACGLVTCTVLGTLGYAVQNQREAQMHKAIDDLNKIANDPDPMGFAKIAEERRREEAQRAFEYEQAHSPPPLGPNERCVGETRLRRVENGWVQSGSCPQ